MKSQSISVKKCPQDAPLNGIGAMMQQFLEQNFADFKEKERQARRIRCRMSVEMERGIASTIDFRGNEIMIENGVTGRPDLLMHASYQLLARILAGQASPFWELVRGNIKLKNIPRRPISSYKALRLLMIPDELLIDGGKAKRRRKRILSIASLTLLALALMGWVLTR